MVAFGGAAINPAATEIIGDGIDQDCDNRDGARRWFALSTFASTDWTTTGLIAGWGDKLAISSFGGSATRSVVGNGKGHIYAVLDVTAVTGSSCTATFQTTFVSAVASQTVAITTAGTHVFDFNLLHNPPRTLSKVTFACNPLSSMQVDWLVLQDTPEVIFPPAEDAEYTWEATGAPGGGYHTGVVRASSDGVVWGASDVGGVGVWDPLPAASAWRVANGVGRDGLHEYEVWDVAAVDWEGTADHEVYALTGTSYGAETIGGLWRSTDDGDSWDRVADTLVDGIGFSGRQSDCPGGGADKAYAGGRLLLADESNELLYVASNNAHQSYDLDGDDYTPMRESGVYVWEQASEDLCRDHLDADGDGDYLDPLPIPGLASDKLLGAIEMVESPSGIPALVVGYRSPGGSEDAVYVCQLKSLMSCADIEDVVCTPFIDLQGVDVRDIEPDTYDASRFFVATGGEDPELAAESCSVGDGELLWVSITDDGADVAPDTVDDVSGAGWSSAFAGITGVSMDPAANVVLAFVPGSLSIYGAEGLYRIPYDDLVSGNLSAWEIFGDTGDTEAQARRENTNYSGAWLEAGTVAEPVPEPELWSPGFAVDGIWYTTGTGANRALLTTWNNLWSVQGLDDTSPGWDPEDHTYWVFAPDIEPMGQTWSTMAGSSVAVDQAGTIWMPMGDHGLLYHPEGAYADERDCLFELYGAGGVAVSVGVDDSVWIALRHQGTGVPHSMGVFKTLNHGEEWEYQGAGVVNAASRDPLEPDNRVICRDRVPADHYALPIGGSSGAFFTENPYAYSLSDPADPCLASWGNPGDIDALDATVAVVAFQGYQSLEAESCTSLLVDPTYSATGGLAYTPDGGATWVRIPFDGNAVVTPRISPDPDECPETEFFLGAPTVSILHPESDTWWDDDNANGKLDAGEDFQLTLLVGSDWGTYTARDSCGFAKVTVTEDSLDWEWYRLDKNNSAEYGDCRVDASNIVGLAASPWSDEAFVWGAYHATGPHRPLSEYGGICSVALSDHTVTSILSPVAEDNAYELYISEVIPHPYVADLLWAVPRFTSATLAACALSVKDGGPEICPEAPLPMLLEREGNSASHVWKVTQLEDTPPGLTGNAGAWGPDGTHLYYTTGGSGTWIGVPTWAD